MGKFLIKVLGIMVVAWVAIDVYTWATTGSFDSGISVKAWELAKEGFEWFRSLIKPGA